MLHWRLNTCSVPANPQDRRGLLQPRPAQLPCRSGTCRTPCTGRAGSGPQFGRRTHKRFSRWPHTPVMHKHARTCYGTQQRSACHCRGFATQMACAAGPTTAQQAGARAAPADVAGPVAGAGGCPAASRARGHPEARTARRGGRRAAVSWRHWQRRRVLRRCRDRRGPGVAARRGGASQGRLQATAARGGGVPGPAAGPSAGRPSAAATSTSPPCCWHHARGQLASQGSCGSGGRRPRSITAGACICLRGCWGRPLPPHAAGGPARAGVARGRAARAGVARERYARPLRGGRRVDGGGGGRHRPSPGHRLALILPADSGTKFLLLSFSCRVFVAEPAAQTHTLLLLGRLGRRRHAVDDVVRHAAARAARSPLHSRTQRRAGGCRPPAVVRRQHTRHGPAAAPGATRRRRCPACCLPHRPAPSRRRCRSACSGLS